MNDVFDATKITVKSVPNKPVQYFIFEYNDDDLLRKVQIDRVRKLRIETANAVKEYLAGIMKKARHVVGSLHHSEPMNRDLGKTQSHLNAPQVKLVQDVPHRWHSSLDMLDSYILNANVLRTMALKDQHASLNNHLLDEDELEFVSELCALLRPLKDVSILLGGSKYVTINHLYPTIFNLIYYELNEVSISSEKMQVLKDDLIESLQMRLNYVFKNNLFKSVTFLDPQYKNFDFIKVI